MGGIASRCVREHGRVHLGESGLKAGNYCMTSLDLFGALDASKLPLRVRDLARLKIGNLTVRSFVGISTDGHAIWLCDCVCGCTREITSNSLTRRNSVKSCGCAKAIAAKQRRKPGGSWNEGRSYAIGNGKHCYRNRAAWSKAVIRHYGNKCQRCGWAEARCDAHHKTPKSLGGLHTIKNGIVLCPNCHRIAHENERIQ